MNLHQRIREVRSHIDKLQETANKHMANRKKRSYNLICETIKDNKSILRVLDEDLIKKERINLVRINYE